MNLSEFPISVLQRNQPLDQQGAKIDRVSYESSRYDPTKKQRVQQRVVLETNSRYGLPTPADENVVLALLFVAKHADNFASPSVHFSPRQLFRIMGWSPNSRSYQRLRVVLRRLKALVIRYENSWWDASDRGYEAEFATGLISEYELSRQVAGRKKGAEKPANWVRWSPHFHQSLCKGNLKKLNLEQLFSLKLPTTQRMYRFLDKRFYPRHQPPAVEMDLWDFACGHVGLARVNNVAELKRRLAPAIAELEKIGFIAAADSAARYQKIKAGVWRIRFQAGASFAAGLPSDSERAALPLDETSAPDQASIPACPDQELAALYYQTRSGGKYAPIGPSDLTQARELIQKEGYANAQAIVTLLAQIVRRKWPDCRSFSGAASKYLHDAIQAHQQQEQRTQSRRQTTVDQARERGEAIKHMQRQRQLEARWDSLTDEHRAAIERDVLQEFPELRDRPGLLKGFCLNKLR
jgi:hypothetical protein